MARKTKAALVIKHHILKPKHSILSDKERKNLFSKYKITFNELPKINLIDPSLAGMEVKEGDVVKIVRESVTAITSEYYRGVINV
ncbi:MAG: DNA-directed RNA polymerase subunit RpoH/Rpb5 C-terminal domain-containing protein [Nanoarchaeota archaeon]|nr:DNA-directed RNA polymerase subunit RpoH/Rpb5 C-terminal domain-containing protein [Nanoarchaeota archaeon]